MHELLHSHCHQPKASGVVARATSNQSIDIAIRFDGHYQLPDLAIIANFHVVSHLAQEPGHILFAIGVASRWQSCDVAHFFTS